jgi:hypothetical protein
MAAERNAALLQEAGYTTATGRPEQSSDLAHGAGSIHEGSNPSRSTIQSFISQACRRIKRDPRVSGVLLWNVWDKVENARALITRKPASRCAFLLG